MLQILIGKAEGEKLLDNSIWNVDFEQDLK